MYRAELFNMFTHSFVSAFAFEETVEIKEDYMSPQVFDIPAPADIEVELKNTLMIKRDTESYSVFRGFVKDIHRTDTETTITVAPMMMLLNEKSMQNTAHTAWRSQLYRQIYWDFMQSTPSLYSVPWIYWSSQPIGNWDGVAVNYGAVLKSDMQCIIEARQIYGKFMVFSIGISGDTLGRPYFGFKKFTGTKVIEADLDNIVAKDIKETTQGGYNIAQFWYPRSEGSTNYLHTDAVLIDGVIYNDGSRKSEIADPRLTSKTTNDASPDSATIWQFFRDMLKPSSDNYEISITVKDTDPLVQPTYMLIGQPVRVLSGGKEYNTHMTGYSRQGDLFTIKLGTVRQSLTAILNSEED